MAAGFTLIELTISLAILLFALALAAQILMETAQLFADSERQNRATSAPEAISRLRGDVLGATTFSITLHHDGTMDRLFLFGHPEGTVAYELLGGQLVRSVIAGSAPPSPGTPLWQGVTGWTARALPAGGPLLDVEIDYLEPRAPRLLALLPGVGPPLILPRTQRLFLLPRGAGLGGGW
jgi:prepilin-type N-terminal cleavage/methylation domain-containing protein